MIDHSVIKNLKYDIPAGIVVFFVALPLCLGIALASGAPLFSGVIAGIVGGAITGFISKSPLGVSGPAAGLAVIVFGYVEALNGSWEAFLLAVFVAGIMQVIFGFLKLGTIAYYFPSSVIKGMLSGIGLLIILKQLPFATGLKDMVLVSPGSLFISAISMLLLVVFEMSWVKKHSVVKLIPSPLLVVALGIVLFNLFEANILPYNLAEDRVVSIPVSNGLAEFFGQFTMPDFSQFTNPKIYLIAAVIALVASIETLLCVEATDKLDPQRRVTPTNRELKAQGIGNMVSGLIGGLPITQVIVRSSANINFGARTKMSAIFHGILLLVCVIMIPTVLNMIPLPSLACILILVGYKLSHPALFKEVFKKGMEHFLPFIATIIGMVIFDLLIGITIGLFVAVFFLLKNNYHNPYELFEIPNNDDDNEYHIVLAEEVTFLNKEKILRSLNKIPENSIVTIDGSKSKYIHHDVLEIIENFKIHAKSFDIVLKLKGINI